MDLKGKITVVTGGNRGIGFELCQHLLTAGATVILTARDEARGRAAVENLRKDEGRLFFHVLDVCDDESTQTFANFIEREFGQLDILFNNAGVALDKFVPSSQLDIDVLRRTIDTNVLGVFRTTQALIPALKASSGARIVNVSSQLGSLSMMTGYTLAYRMSKTAVNAMTRVWASELKDDGILVNSVCPGWVRTDLGGEDAPIRATDGARSILELALIDDDGPTGTFVRDGNPHPW